MSDQLDRPTAGRTLVVVVFCVSAMLAVRGMEFHNETITGVLLYTPIFALIGFGLGTCFVQATSPLRSGSWRQKLRATSQFIKYTVLTAYIGWFLWQPWLWLMR